MWWRWWGRSVAAAPFGVGPGGHRGWGRARSRPAFSGSVLVVTVGGAARVADLLPPSRIACGARCAAPSVSLTAGPGRSAVRRTGRSPSLRSVAPPAQARPHQSHEPQELRDWEETTRNPAATLSFVPTRQEVVSHVTGVAPAHAAARACSCRQRAVQSTGRGSQSTDAEGTAQRSSAARSLTARPGRLRARAPHPPRRPCPTRRAGATPAPKSNPLSPATASRSPSTRPATSRRRGPGLRDR